MGTYVGENLTGLDFVALVVPVLVVLLTWLGIMFWADAHPQVRHVGSPPPTSGSIREPLTPRGHSAAGATLAAEATGAADEEEGGARAPSPGATQPAETPAERPE
jgi:hypothetical protein